MIVTSVNQSRQLAGYREYSDCAWVAVPSGGYVLSHICGKDSTPAFSLAALWQIVHDSKKVYEFDTNIPARELMDELVSIITHEYAREEVCH